MCNETFCPGCLSRKKRPKVFARALSVVVLHTDQNRVKTSSGANLVARWAPMVVQLASPRQTVGAGWLCPALEKHRKQGSFCTSTQVEYGDSEDRHFACVRYLLRKDQRKCKPLTLKQSHTHPRYLLAALSLSLCLSLFRIFTHTRTLFLARETPLMNRTLVFCFSIGISSPWTGVTGRG